MYETVHWINTLRAYYQIFLCFVFNFRMPESTEWSFSSCCPSKNNRADWYAATSPTPPPRSKETLHWGTTRWERVRTAGISGGIKSAILLHSPKWNVAGEGLLLAQFIGQQPCRTFGRWQQLLQAHPLVSLSGCTVLKLWLAWFIGGLLSIPSILHREEQCVQVKEMTGVCYWLV